MNQHDFEKTEPGFIGSLILTSEHIMDKVSGTVPVVGLFISAAGALGSLIWYRKSLTNWQKGLRLLLAASFATLGAVVLTFPFTGLAVGLGVAIFSVISNIYEKISHSTKQASHKNEGSMHEAKHHMRMLNQHTYNSFMSVASLTCITVSLLVPAIAPAILGIFITSTLVFLALTFASNKLPEQKKTTSYTQDEKQYHDKIEQADETWKHRAHEQKELNATQTTETKPLPEKSVVEKTPSHDNEDNEGEGETKAPHPPH